jgi:phosphoglycolate phosphatase
LIALRRADVTLAVCTNKLQYLSEIILRDLDVAQYFSTVVGSRPNLPRKPDPASLHHALETMNIPADAAVMVGDSPVDIEAARAAGIRVILVEFGYASPMAVTHTPDATMARYADLPDLLDSIRGNS